MQCFPDSYIFYGSRSDKNLQIGNAVPTFLSIALKDSIKEYLVGTDRAEQQWLEENKAAIDGVNERIEKEGLFSDEINR